MSLRAMGFGNLQAKSNHNAICGLAALFLSGAMFVAGCAGVVGGDAPPKTPTPPVTVPAISSFSPTSGAAGTSVTVTGTDLSGATAVSFNGTNATFQVLSATQFSATVPSGATTGKITVTTPDGNAASSANFSVTGPTAPTIASFAPTSGPVGISVTLTGTNLTGATAVNFNGMAATFQVISATQISATVPTGASTGKISVTTPNGTASSATNFSVTVAAAPSISSFTPTSGVVAAAVTITGTNFTGATGVKFNGTSATFQVASATQITTTVPSGASTGRISVTTPNGTATSAGSFTVTAPATPTISSFTPTSGVVGAAVTVTGTNFTGATSVKFNGTSATFQVASTTQITTTVPSGASTGKISVTTPNGTATSTGSFTVTVSATPTISSFTPTSGVVGAAVTITGTNFTGATGVKFNGTSATFQVASATQITTTVPSGASTGKISVTTPNGTATSAGSFTVTVPATPTISSFTPTSGVVGAAVTVTGTNFTGATSVKFNGTSATFQVASTTQITTAVPSGASTGKVSVTTANGTATSAGSFTVAVPATPTISSFTPTSGVVGAAVTITGANFTGATSVRFNGTSATFQVASATQITTTVPSGASTGKISVTTPNGTATSAGSFTVTVPATPTISSFTPTSGVVGAAVTVTGTNFTGATSVKFNGTSATFQVSSATQISTTVPSGASTGKISVTTPNGTATSASSFTVTTPAAPTISSFSPTSGSAGTGVTITGTGFTGATSVKFNGTAATFSVTDSAHISTSVPASATTGKVSVTTPNGTATSSASFTVNVTSGLDLTIDGLYVTQATQNYPAHDVPLIENRSAWVRVFVLANETNTAQPQVQVKFTNGSTTNTLTINDPGSSVPTAVNVGSATSSWNAAVPASWILPGVQIVATVDPANQIAESNKGNNQFSEAPTVESVHQWKITLIPVKTGDGRIGVIENSTRDRNTLVSIARQLWPVPDSVDVTVGAQMTSSVTSLASSGTGWSTVLSELLAKRTADGITDRYYFGFVNVSYNSGVAGLGYVGAPAAIGWDLSGAQSVLAHEVGHNFGRLHSPCGGAADPDPNYPYPGGTIGVPGWDVFATSNNLKPTTDTDIMGYCSNQWVSDYVYKSVLSFRAANPFDIVTAAAVSNGPKTGLLVWGRVENGNLVLEPAFRVPVTGATVQPGPYVWEAHDSQGRVLARVPFQTHEVADLPYQSSENFAFIVPMDDASISVLQSVHVMKGAAELTARQAQNAERMKSATSALRVADLAGQAAEIDWDSTTQPMIMLRDANTGKVRGFLRGGSAQVGDMPAEIEVQLSDGVKSTIVRHARTVEP